MRYATALKLEPMDPRKDAALAAKGDAEVFERLYRDTVGRIHALARRMAGPESADDLTQEVYLRAWTKLGSFRGESSFSTWLHRLAVNLILTRRASARKREKRHVAGDGILETMTGRVMRPGIRIDVEAAMLTLPDGARDVFVLYDIEGYTHDEIGGMLGISTGTSKSQLHRARMLLRNRLN